MKKYIKRETATSENKTVSKLSFVQLLTGLDLSLDSRLKPQGLR